MGPVLTDEDRPPPPRTRRRPPPRGVLVASGLTVIVLAIATFVAFRADDGSGGPVALEPGQPFPGQLGEGRDVTGESASPVHYAGFDGGAAVDVASFAGRPLVINYFAAWCTSCIEEMPAIERTFQAYRDRVAFLGVSTDNQQESGKAIVERTGVTYPLAYDKAGQTLETFGAMTMPVTAFIDETGTITYVHQGKLDEQRLSELIDEKLLS